jgi:hypothetical protein
MTITIPTRAIRRVVAILVLAVTPALTVGAPAGADTTGCPSGWGSRPKTATPAGVQGLQFLLNVRAGQHPCYDRIVLDVTGNDNGPTGYSVSYGPVVHNENTAEPVPVAGGAVLQVALGRGSFDHGSQSPAFHPADPTNLVDVTGFRTLRQIAWADTELADDTSTLAIGVRARLPMRAFLLPSPTQAFGQRLVIDIAHHW